MTMTGLPLIGQLKDRLHWLQSRQKLLAENVANSSTPNFKPRDMKPASQAQLSLKAAQTNTAHLGAVASVDGATGKANRFETVPSGNAVSLEDEMLKLADTQADYQAAASLYSKSLSMLKIALGKRG